jgi:hypothetical protein
MNKAKVNILYNSNDIPVVAYVNTTNRAKNKASFSKFFLEKLKDQKSGFYTRKVEIDDEDLRTMKRSEKFSSKIWTRWCVSFENFLSFGEKV